MQDVAQLARRVEDRLQRLLASGWRHAGQEAQELMAQADTLTQQGLPELAWRLRQVAAAGDATEALAAVAMSLAALRLLRAHLPVDDPPSGNWSELASTTRKRPLLDRLLPVSRLTLASGEAWACVRLRGTQPSELVLLTPVQSPPASPWLRCPLQGRLRWQGRYALGTGGEVQLCTVLEATWDDPPAPEEDPLALFRSTIAKGKLQEDMSVFKSGSALRCKRLDSAALDACVWFGDDVQRAFQDASGGDDAWALIWQQGPLVTPLCVVIPGGLLRKALVAPLVPGAAFDPLEP